MINILDYNRIVIVGNNGSGKSFLAKKLADLTSLPLIHLDAEFWRPNWGMPSQEEWLKKNKEFISKEKWIIDGMCSHGGTIELRFVAADLVIFLDINRLSCLIGIFKRNGKKRTDTVAHQDEKFDIRFIQFCKGVWDFPKTRKRTIINLHNKHFNKPFFVINSKRKMNKLLDQWNKSIPYCLANEKHN
ncbi:MAG: topology modulation protein [Oscillospiraceae bacterium]|jgi:adenylate kinase family enzyme|nr:topology modulation protein [Oscillospiraceae bacterium]